MKESPPSQTDRHVQEGSRDRRKGRTGREFLWVISAQFASLLAGFVGLKILTNLLTTAQFGLYQLGWSAALVVATFLFNPMGHAFIRLFPLHAANGHAIGFFSQAINWLQRFAVVILAIGAICAVLAMVIDAWPVLLVIATLLAILGHGMTLLFQHYQSALRLRARYAAFQVLIAFGRPLASVVALYGLALEDETRAAIALGGSGLFLILVAVAQYQTVKTAVTSHARISDEEASAEVNSSSLPAIGNVAIPMSVIGVLVAVSQYLDRWMIGGMLDFSSVGAYTAIFQITAAPLNFAQGTANRFSLPIIFDSMGKGSQEERARAYRQIRKLTLLWITMIGGAILVSVLAHRLIVELLTNQQIARYSLLLPYLLSGLALERTAQVLTVRGNLEMKIGKYVPGRLLHILLLIVFSVLLAPDHGIFGFAYAHCIAGFAILVATLWLNRRYLLAG